MRPHPVAQDQCQAGHREQCSTESEAVPEMETGREEVASRQLRDARDEQGDQQQRGLRSLHFCLLPLLLTTTVSISNSSSIYYNTYIIGTCQVLRNGSIACEH